MSATHTANAAKLADIGRLEVERRRLELAIAETRKRDASDGTIQPRGELTKQLNQIAAAVRARADAYLAQPRERE